MALKPITIIQGDSYAADIKAKSGALLSTSWSGKWAIVATLGATPVVDGALLYGTNGEYLALRILSSDTADIPIGKYYLVVQVDDTEVGYHKEIVQRQIIITAQGIAEV